MKLKGKQKAATIKKIGLGFICGTMGGIFGSLVVIYFMRR